MSFLLHADIPLFSVSSLPPVVISEGKYPGAMELMRIPVRMNSVLIILVRWMIAALAAL